MVVLPQVKVGMLAIAVFAFIRGWEEYVFVRTLLIAQDELDDEPLPVLDASTT